MCHKMFALRRVTPLATALPGDESPRNRLLTLEEVVSLHDQQLAGTPSRCKIFKFYREMHMRTV